MHPSYSLPRLYCVVFLSHPLGLFGVCDCQDQCGCSPLWQLAGGSVLGHLMISSRHLTGLCHRGVVSGRIGFKIANHQSVATFGCNARIACGVYRDACTTSAAHVAFSSVPRAPFPVRSLIDGKDFYEQIRIIDEHIPRTLFVMPDGTMESLVLQLGDCNV